MFWDYVQRGARYIQSFFFQFHEKIYLCRLIQIHKILLVSSCTPSANTFRCVPHHNNQYHHLHEFSYARQQKPRATQGVAGMIIFQRIEQGCSFW